MLHTSRPGGNAGGRSDPAPADVGPATGPSWPPVNPADLPAETVLPRLSGVTQTSDTQWSACCPAHLDDHPSLSITETDDLRLLIHCHAGCHYESVLAAVGLEAKHLFPTRRARFVAKETGRRKSLELTAARSTPSVDVEPPISEAHLARFAVEERRSSIGRIGGLDYLAGLLGLPVFCLEWLNVGHLSPPGVWSFPEYDGRGRVVGITTRGNEGEKKAIPGSRRGLTLPERLPRAAAEAAPLSTSALYVAEGATDTAALLSVGCMAIGRPAATPSALVRGFLAELLDRCPELHQGYDVIVVGDNDPHGAGARGALATREFLQQTLGRAVHAARPPDQFKDMRQQVVAGSWSAGLIPLR